MFSRITIMSDGQCIIGMKRLAMIPLIGFDLLVNVRLDPAVPLKPPPPVGSWMFLTLPPGVLDCLVLDTALK